MMQFTLAMRFYWLASTLSSLVLLAACSAAPEPSAYGQEAKSTKANKDAGKTEEAEEEEETPKKKADAGPAAPAGGACSAEKTVDTCYDCCIEGNQAAFQAFNLQFGTCVCQTPGICATECGASACAGIEPTKGDACDTCLSGAKGKQCSDIAGEACAKDPKCAVLFTCADDSACDGKTP